MKKLLIYLLPFITISCTNTVQEPYLDEDGIPIPTHSYVNDFTGEMIDTGHINTLNTALRKYEDSTTNQIVVICLPEIPVHATGTKWDIAELATMTIRKWGIGQQKKNNGVLLTFYLEDHKDNISLGDGLEGALPDITCKRILEEKVKPLFREKEYEAGIDTAIACIQRSVAGEFAVELKQKDAEEEFWKYLLWGMLVCSVIAAISMWPGSILGGLFGGIFWYTQHGNELFLSILVSLLCAAIAIIGGKIVRFIVREGLDIDSSSSSSNSSSTSTGFFSSGGGSSSGGGASDDW